MCWKIISVIEINYVDKNLKQRWEIINLVKIHWCDESSKCDKKFFIVMKFHHSTVMKNQHWDINWWIWWKLIDMMKSLDCDNISHWDNNSSLWWKLFKGMKINPSIWREQIDVMKVHKCDENRSNTMKIH